MEKRLNLVGTPLKDIVCPCISAWVNPKAKDWENNVKLTFVREKSSVKKDENGNDLLDENGKKIWSKKEYQNFYEFVYIEGAKNLNIRDYSYVSTSYIQWPN